MNITTLHALSNRQRQCAEYLLQGLTAKEISQLLNLSQRTVEHYFDNLRKRLNCKNKSQLIMKLVMTYES
jgi:DNA-binding CsgD family transcriptional regulator